MQKTIEAIYEHGVLRPLQVLEGLTEQQKVLVTVNAAPPAHPLAGWVGDLPDEDAREMMSIIDREFNVAAWNDGH